MGSLSFTTLSNDSFSLIDTTTLTSLNPLTTVNVTSTSSVPHGANDDYVTSTVVQGLNSRSDSHPHYAFMYGTLKTNEPNHKQLYSKGPGGAKFCGRARTVAKFPLLVTTPFNIPFLLHKEGIGHRIEGELYRLDEETLKHVDDFEGHPHWYVRQPVQVEVTTDSMSNKIQPYIVDSWMYGLKRFKPSLLELPLVPAYHNNPADINKQYKHYDVEKDGSLNRYLFDDD